MNLEQEIVRILEDARMEIQTNLADKNINASGNTSASIRVVRDAEGFKLMAGGTGAAPIETTEIGRPGGNVPGGFVTLKDGTQDVSNKFKWILKKWSEDKGLDMNWGAVTMLGRRIAAEGTRRHKEHVDVYSTPTKNAVAKLNELINSSIQMQLQAAIQGFKTEHINTNF